MQNKALMIAFGLLATVCLIRGQGQPTGIVAGRVVDAAGSPIPAATVMLLTGPAPQGPARGQSEYNRVLTDDSGRFVFSNVRPSSYRVEANKPGWLAGALGRKRPGGSGSTIDLPEGARRNDLVITLFRAAVIAGRVIDDNGDPLIGAEVRAIKQVFIAGRAQNDQPIRTLTDDRGEYRFPGLLPGDYLVGTLSSVLSEPPGFDAVARTTPDQQPPRAYMQTMTSMGATPVIFDRASGVVGADRALIGSLTPLTDLPPLEGAWLTYPTTFHPSASTQENATVVRVKAGDVREAINITARLMPTFTVSGTLRDGDGAAAWHAVHLVPAETGDRPVVDVATAVTDSKGVFTLYGVPAGRYIARVIRVPVPNGARFGICGGTGAIPQICAVLSGPPSASPPVGSTESLWYVGEPVAVSDRPIRDLALVMHEGPRVRGSARFEGTRPQPSVDEWRSASVSLMPASGRVDLLGFPSPFSNDSRFVSASLWPGRYVIQASPPAGWYFKDATYEGRDVSSRAIDIAKDLESIVVTFTDQLRTLKGSVQVEPGASADDAMVVLFPTDQTLWVDYGRTSRLLASTRVTTSGQYSLSLPPVGDYFIVAIPEESADEWQNPSMLATLSRQAERIKVSGDASLTQQLSLKRNR